MTRSLLVNRRAVFHVLSTAAVAGLVTLWGCKGEATGNQPPRTVPHQDAWGIYRLDLTTQDVTLVYSTPNEIQTSALRLNGNADRLVFAQKTGGTADENLEIYTLGIGGQQLTRLTDNAFLDVYPAWSPDGTRIAFLSRRVQDLDIYVMNADGTNVQRLYDSGGNDGDIDWKGNTIVFTAQFAIWQMAADGSGATRITDPPHRGEWGQANLPAGDYDPRLSPGGNQVVFERLEDTSVPNGAYNLFAIDVGGTGETRLTDNGYAQGLASWSNAGDRLVYIVSAINGQGKYDLYLMNADGTDNHDITPDYFPAGFLCQSPIFSRDDAAIYFIGQWWG